MRTIVVANHKGGCGKTTTAVNLAAAFAMSGKRVLLIDLDPQAHATLALGCEPEALDKTVYDIFRNPGIAVSELVTKSSVKGLNLVPSNILLSGSERELAELFRRECILSERLSRMNGFYDICFIDCPPSLGLLTLNALVAGIAIIIPVQTHYYALESLKRLLQTLGTVRKCLNQNLEVLGILLTFVDNRTRLSRQIQQQLKEFFGDLVFDTVIHKNVRLAEAPSAGESIFTYAPECRGAAEYRILAEEISNGRK